LLKESDVKYLLSIKSDDIDKKLIISLFANKKKSNARFKPNDKFILPAGNFKLKENITTTVGRYIFNRFIIEPDFLDIFGYVNETITGGKLGDIESVLSQSLMDDKITVDAFGTYLNKIQWLGFSFTDMFSPSLSYSTVVPLEKVNKRKEELLKEHEEDLKTGDVAVIGAKIEAELIDLAKQELKGNPSMDMYDSGARGKFSNHYKNQAIMRGPVLDTSTGKFKLAESNYADGVKKEEFNIFADMITDAAYNVAVGTQMGGYQTKRLFAAFQSVTLDKAGSDCHSKGTLKVIINKFNKKLFLYRYIVEKGKLVLLDNDNINNYLDKVVQLRSPLFCTSERLCSKCAGELYYKLGIENIGLTTSKIGGSMLNLCLKKKHDVTLKLNTIDYRNYME
jgi:hypothetical protein